MIEDSHYWEKFFQQAGLPNYSASRYASFFVNNRITNRVLPDLNKQDLQEMGIEAIGDIIGILKLARNYSPVDSESSLSALEKAGKRTPTASSNSSGSKKASASISNTGSGKIASAGQESTTKLSSHAISQAKNSNNNNIKSASHRVLEKSKSTSSSHHTSKSSSFSKTPIASSSSNVGGAIGGTAKKIGLPATPKKTSSTVVSATPRIASSSEAVAAARSSLAAAKQHQHTTTKTTTTSSSSSSSHRKVVMQSASSSRARPSSSGGAALLTGTSCSGKDRKVSEKKLTPLAPPPPLKASKISSATPPLASSNQRQVTLQQRMGSKHQRAEIGVEPQVAQLSRRQSEIAQQAKLGVREEEFVGDHFDGDGMEEEEEDYVVGDEDGEEYDEMLDNREQEEEAKDYEEFYDDEEEYDVMDGGDNYYEEEEEGFYRDEEENEATEKDFDDEIDYVDEAEDELEEETDQDGIIHNSKAAAIGRMLHEAAWQQPDTLAHKKTGIFGRLGAKINKEPSRMHLQQSSDLQLAGQSAQSVQSGGSRLGNRLGVTDLTAASTNRPIKKVQRDPVVQFVMNASSLSAPSSIATTSSTTIKTGGFNSSGLVLNSGNSIRPGNESNSIKSRLGTKRVIQTTPSRGDQESNVVGQSASKFIKIDYLNKTVGDKSEAGFGFGTTNQVAPTRLSVKQRLGGRTYSDNPITVASTDRQSFGTNIFSRLG